MQIHVVDLRLEMDIKSMKIDDFCKFIGFIVQLPRLELAIKLVKSDILYNIIEFIIQLPKLELGNYLLWIRSVFMQVHVVDLTKYS